MTRVLTLAAFTLLACADATPAVAAERAPRTPSASSAAPDPSADLDWRGKLTAGAALALNNINGDLKVTRAKGKQARVRAFKTGPGADKVKIVVKEQADFVSIKTKYSTHNTTVRDGVTTRGASVRFLVELPDGVEFDADLINGDIDSKGAVGPLDLASINGHVTASGAADISVSVINGRAVVRVPKKARRAKLDAVNGVAEVRLPASAGAKVRASTVHGSIESDFPLKRGDEFVGSKASGILGDGKTTVTLSTVNGRIKIKKS